MWSRIVECMLGCWLLVSPFVFRHSPDDPLIWANDFIAGGLMIVLSLASFWKPTEWAHWLLLGVGLWLVGFGRFARPLPAEPALQNAMVVGLLVATVVRAQDDFEAAPINYSDSGLKAREIAPDLRRRYIEWTGWPPNDDPPRLEQGRWVTGDRGDQGATDG